MVVPLTYCNPLLFAKQDLLDKHHSALSACRHHFASSNTDSYECTEWTTQQAIIAPVQAPRHCNMQVLEAGLQQAFGLTQQDKSLHRCYFSRPNSFDSIAAMYKLLIMLSAETSIKGFHAPWLTYYV